MVLMPLLSRLLTLLVILTMPLFLARLTLIPIKSLSIRSEERFSRNAETDLVCRLLLEKKKEDNNVGLLMNALEDLGYVSRSPAPSDSRRQLVDIDPTVVN